MDRNYKLETTYIKTDSVNPKGFGFLSYLGADFPLASWSCYPRFYGKNLDGNAGN